MTDQGIKIVVQNRKAFHEYTISERVEAGIALTGTEVKSIRAGKISINDAWVDLDGSRATLRDCTISPYSFGNIMNHPDKRPRQLLLKIKEIAKLGQLMAAKGFTILPLKVYFKGSLVKLEIGVAKGKKLHDKRQATQKREVNRAIERAMKR